MADQTFTAPLVGDYYRPPAKAIIQSIPTNTSLILRREPDNPYDENAVKVIILTENIPQSSHETLESLAGPYGFSLEEILAEEEWHLGYISKEFAVHLTKLLEPEDTDYSAHLSFFVNEKGKNNNAVEITINIESE